MIIIYDTGTYHCDVHTILINLCTSDTSPLPFSQLFLGSFLSAPPHQNPIVAIPAMPKSFTHIALDNFLPFFKHSWAVSRQPRHTKTLNWLSLGHQNPALAIPTAPKSFTRHLRGTKTLYKLKI